MQQHSTTHTTTPTAQQLRPYILGSRFVDNMLDTLNRQVQYGTLPACIDTATYGIQWARQTGRLPYQAEVAIRGLRPVQVARLVADVAAACPTIGDVPRYLIRRYCPVE